MPQTRSVCVRASVWKGQFARVRTSSSHPGFETLLLQDPPDDGRPGRRPLVRGAGLLPPSSTPLR